MTKKNSPRSSVAAAAQRARDAATQVVPTAKNAVPMAKNAVPMAKNAGVAARHTAEDAVAWAVPLVHDARAWAAPRVEHAGLAVRDKIAPTIADALLDAAHRLDQPARQRRRWPRLLAGIAMVAAACSAAAAAILRRQSAETGMEGGSSEHGATATEATQDMAAGDGQPSSGPEADDQDSGTNGRVHSS
jgi:hypothetical protein